MGNAVIRLVLADAGLSLVAAVAEPGAKSRGSDAGELAGVARCGLPVTVLVAEAIAAKPKVAIDFTTPAASVLNVAALASAGIPCVVGTTGFSDAQRARLRGASSKVAVLLAPNMSAGANTLFELVQRAVELLGPGYDCEIVETHHSGKKDAPSGTALRLAEVVQASRGGRSTPVQMHSLRMGDVVGEHRVSFAGTGEWIELTHRALSRDAFARGALRAARFVAGARSGFYTMRDAMKA